MIQVNNRIATFNNRIRISDNRDVIPKSGLFLHYDTKFTDCYPRTGTTVFDLSGNGRNGTLMNGVGFTEANYGSFVFDGTNDYIKSTFTNPVANISISTWIYGTFTNVRGFFELVGINDLISSNPLWLVNNNLVSTTSIFSLYNTGSNTYMSSAVAYTQNTWWNITIIRTNGSSEAIYINGEFKKSRAVGTLGNMGVRINLGAGYPNYFAGRIPIFLLYNKRLTDTEILQIYNAYKYRF